MGLGSVLPVVGPFVNDTLWIGDRLVTPVDVGSGHLTHGPQMTRSVNPMLLLGVAAAATGRMRPNTSTLR
ncbi:hypothetical protein [Actinomadura sp. 9N407]|uniref:hypothetical protein n=1 Tax=Actinomadura sp. 9N407 TaxID=3375154 RepID=UPI0037A6E263